MSRHVMSKNALDSRIKEGTLGPSVLQASAGMGIHKKCPTKKSDIDKISKNLK